MPEGDAVAAIHHFIASFHAYPTFALRLVLGVAEAVSSADGATRAARRD